MSLCRKTLALAASFLNAQFYENLVNSCMNVSLPVQLLKPHIRSNIHPTAIVHDEVFVDDDVVIGPYSCIGPGVVLGQGCRVSSHVSIHKDTIIGDHSIIHSFSSIGGDPQDLKYATERTWLILGSQNTIREYVSVNRGTGAGGGITKSGRSCLIMSNCHVSITDHIHGVFKF